MRKILLLPAFVLFLFHSNTCAQQITWAKDIACIVYSHCGSCHGADENIAGLKLNSYQDVFNNRLAVELYTHVKSMPPWLPDDAYSRLKGSKQLSAMEIALIKEWAIGDALRGDSTQEPPAPVYHTPAATLSNPDLSVKLPDYIIPDSAGHYRRCFVLTAPFAVAQKIKSIEVIPGNAATVHGVFLYTDTSSLAVQLDDADTEPGYEWFYGIGSATAKPFYGWVPGAGAFTYPTSMGLGIDSGARIIVQLEYSEEAGGKLDSTRINLHWDHDSTSREIGIATWLSHEHNLLNGPFEIPVDSVRTFHERYELSTKKTVMGIAPNLHGICDKLKVYAILPTQDTLPLLAVNNWNPVWNEAVYYFKEAQILPAGSVLFASATFSNTAANSHDPKDTLEDVHAGMGHDDEEMIFQFITTDYENGDEAIVMDSNQHAVHHLNCQPLHTVGVNDISTLEVSDVLVYPNPFGKLVTIRFFVAEELRQNLCTIKIVNVMGQEVQNYQLPTSKEEYLTFQWDGVENRGIALNAGIYLVQIKIAGMVKSVKVVKN